LALGRGSKDRRWGRCHSRIDRRTSFFHGWQVRDGEVASLVIWVVVHGTEVVEGVGVVRVYVEGLSEVLIEDDLMLVRERERGAD